MKKAFLGLDPGQTGAACLLSSTGQLHFLDMHKSTPAVILAGLRGWLRDYTVELAVLEQVASRPGQGVTSVFSFGRAYGWWQGVLDATMLPWRLVRPQSWQRGLGADKAKGKAGLVEVAERLWPDAEFRGPRGGILSGRADAALIALWAKRNA